MSDSKPDNDSLMALQALLKIRSDSMVESENASVDNNKRERRTENQDTTLSQQHDAKKKAKPTIQTTQPKHVAIMPSPSLPVSNEKPVPQATPSPSIAPVMHPHALPPSLTLNAGLQNPANLGPNLFYPMTLGPMKPISAPSCSKTLSLGTSMTAKKPPGPHETRPSKQASAKQPKKEQETGEQNAIRVSEIEAALRSKPQRGRKRDNLSALERLELTRTRNREHAKSTRIRKKARYQELLENEQKYEALKKIQELREQRQECVHCFLSIRESMLRTCLEEPETPPEPNQEAVTQPLNDVQGLISPTTTNRVVTFVDPAPAFKARVISPAGDAALIESLSQVVESVVDFEYRTVGNMFLEESTSDIDKGNACPLEASEMTVFDRSLAIKVSESIGETFVSNLSYQVADSAGGIAVNDSGTGFADVLVTTRDRNDQRDLVLMTGILKLQFAPDSAKLKSVMWHTIEERIDELLTHDNEEASDSLSSSSRESLGCQRSFPSVVSLDPIVGVDATGEKLGPSNSEDGPSSGILDSGVSF